MDINKNKCNLLYNELSQLEKIVIKFKDIFFKCDNSTFVDDNQNLIDALNVKSAYPILNTLKNKSKIGTSSAGLRSQLEKALTGFNGGNSKSKDIYFSNSNKTKKKVMMKNGSTKFRIIFHKKDDKKKVEYILLKNTYQKYNKNKIYL